MDTVNIDDMNNILIQEDEKSSESKDLNFASVNKDTAKLLNYVVISSRGINVNESNTYLLDNMEYENIYTDDNKVTPLFKDLICDDEYLPTVNNYSDILFDNSEALGIENAVSESIELSNDQYIVLNKSPFETPEMSKSSSDSQFNEHLNLNLQLDCKLKDNTISLNTPDVIDAIDAIQIEKGFNILNFITEEELIKEETNVSLEDSSTLSNSEELSTSGASSTSTESTRKRKYKSDEDDEDYEPPLSFMKQFSSNSGKRKKHSFSEHNCSNEIKSTKRGRPPKNVLATTSKYGNDNDDKYREMRDKNNEASRKSRLKRKMKECAQEEQVQELEDRNIKLKAQVAELERTVTNFRTNLMQILLKKYSLKKGDLENVVLSCNIPVTSHDAIKRKTVQSKSTPKYESVISEELFHTIMLKMNISQKLYYAKIIKWLVADPVPIECIKSDAVKLLIKRLKSVMKQYDCFGLTATQIGIPLKIMLMQVTAKHVKSYKKNEVDIKEIVSLPLTVIINPELKVIDYTKIVHSEGCQSVIGFMADVPRFQKVEVKGFNENGENITLNFKGWLARIAQHEMDHLIGKLYTDIMDRQTLACSCWQVINEKRGKIEIPFSP
ncbi:hypothetical protein FQA39_LY02805 [Lamprigera yunnana]|nr:hypothetical protein FQA39_LY02805 [Lamprigera yunnana]